MTVSMSRASHKIKRQNTSAVASLAGLGWPLPACTNAARASFLRANKPALFAVMGFCGGAVGVLLAELVPTFHFSGPALTQTIHTALWTGVAASLLTLALSIVLKPRGRDVPSELSSLANHESIYG